MKKFFLLSLFTLFLCSCQDVGILSGNIKVIVKETAPSSPLITGHQIEAVNLVTVEVELRGKCPGAASSVDVEYEGLITNSPCDVLTRTFVTRIPVTDPNNDRLLSYIVAESISAQTPSITYDVNYQRPATPNPTITSNNNTDFSTNITSPILEGTCNSDTTDGMEVRVDGGVWRSDLTSCVNGEWSLDLPGLSGDPAQEYLIEVRTVNSSSDEPYSEVESIRVTVDTALPAMPIMAADATTIDLTPTWSWISGGAGEGTYRYKLDDTDLSFGALETTSNFFTPTTDLSYGPHILYVQERDEVGNWSPSGSQTFTIQCPAGNSYDGTNCVPCTPGHYQPTSNLSVTCLAAPQGTFVSGSGAIALSSCTNKPANAVDVIYDVSTGLTTNTCPIASVSTCALTYAPDGGSCRLMCGLDEYWLGASCGAVGVGYYSPINDDTRYSCSNLPANATAAAYSGMGGGTNNCPIAIVTSCNSNYAPDGATCRLMCPLDQYWNGSACVSVGMGYYSPANDDTRYSCTNMPANASTVTYFGMGGGTNNCPVASVTGCNTNYTIEGMSCRLLCPLDQYWTGSACIGVGNGFYSPANDDTRYTCTNMPANAATVTYSGSGSGTNNCPLSSLTCNSNYVPNGLSCRQLCPVDQYWNGSACVTVGAGYYSPVNDDNRYTCTNTTPNATSVIYSGVGGGANNCPISSVTCDTNYVPNGATCRLTCGLDQYWNGSACVAVGNGYYSPVNDDSRYSCSNLPANATSVTYSGSGAGVNNCPVASVSTCAVNYAPNGAACRAMCGVDQYWNSSACVSVGTGYYSPINNDNRYACTNFPANATAVTYSGMGSGTNSCPVASVTSCAAGFIPSGAVCLDNTPNAFSFTNTTGVNPSGWVDSNAVTVSGFDGPLTVTCSGCAAIARNGSWGGTSVTGVMPGDTIALRLISSGTFLGTVNASATLGATTSSSWSVQTRAGYSCTGTPWGTIAHGATATGYNATFAVAPSTCASQVRTCNDGVLSGSYVQTACTNYPAVTISFSGSRAGGYGYWDTYSMTTVATPAGGSGSNYSYEWSITAQNGGTVSGGGGNNWLTFTTYMCSFESVNFNVRVRDNNLGVYSSWYSGDMTDTFTGVCD
ncbi:hypothetical protein [Peredibacter starrii]|uniref:Uncharacterized protein n=1 Tax=Peredibacter starrii TaxID=28202 RepID=A0AAX4HTI7_9BACT|nr:hypothetical protein [Peredibacter starrii]WPU66629.1 hypothetical protein SOO65_07715 [Peredibacter starrii]